MTIAFQDQKTSKKDLPSLQTTIPDNYQELLENLRKFNTKKELYQSDFFANYSKQLDLILNHIWQQKQANTKPKLTNFLRITHWNIERGKNFDAIVKLFNCDPILQYSDIISLNEVDLGMNRTKNSNIAFELGQKLGMNVYYIAEYIELTKGIGAELNIVGENKESLHGNAILSHYPILSIHQVRLPNCFDTYKFSEKRYGERVALIAEIDLGKKVIWLVNTHLEVRYTPLCRAKQFEAILQTLDKLPVKNSPVIIAGDLNVGTFKRGNFFYSLTGFLRLAFNTPKKLAYQLCHPQAYEPLFAIARKKGFDFKSYNDELPTCTTTITGVDEAKKVPHWLQSRIDKRLAPYNNNLAFRLDYFLARNINALEINQTIDQSTKVQSLNPITISKLRENEQPISDHDPIVCDFAID
ncbi:MAG: endonuclease/exonuclease/phosphatase family protein [Acidobacteria bacterium]|nr:endonuclease/exonuclease/phosphatase family protein [Acidobacteriota bacterium]